MREYIVADLQRDLSIQSLAEGSSQLTLPVPSADRVAKIVTPSWPEPPDSVTGYPEVDFEPPAKSGFEQLHRARRFGASNLVKTPFQGNYGCHLYE